MVETDQLTDAVLLPLLPIGTAEEVMQPSGVAVGQVERVKTCSEAVTAILQGQAVLLIDGSDQALTLGVTGGTRRGVEEPTTEAVIRGPREGFTESLRVNTALVRFRIKSANLKMVSLTLGRETQTNIVLAYVASVANPEVVAEAERRLRAIEIDGVLESAYIEELIEDEPFSPFPQLLHSERPDTISAQLLEGRFAIFVDGTPFVLTGPTTFWEMLQASEDYYERFVLSTVLRWLRFVLAGIALFLPAIYIAITTFHPDMLPTTLILSIAAAREPIPFPALVEAFLMEVAFEALREAGIRLPKTVGQAVSILGALVIGQAAVEAGIVSATMVIVVSVTGIASFSIPRYNAAISLRLLRFPLMLLAGGFGLFGIIIGTVLIAIHACSLRSFGVPYLDGWAPSHKDDAKDILIRAPWWALVRRPKYLRTQNPRRMERGLRPSPQRTGR